MPRQTVLDDELQATVLRFIRGGNLVETAAAAAGIHKDTLYEWLRVAAKARKQTGRLSDYKARCLVFSDAVMVAQAEANAGDIASIATAGRKTTRKVTTTKTDAQGQMEKTDRDEEVLGDWHARAWLVERRERRWNVRVSAELADEDMGGDLESGASQDKAGELIVRVAAMRSRMGSDDDAPAETPTDEPD